MMFSRQTVDFSLALTTSESTSPGFDFRCFSGGQVYVPTGSAITQLTWYASPDGRTYTACYNGSGSAVTSTIAAGENCLIPSACFACGFLKAVISGGTAGTVALTMKS